MKTHLAYARIKKILKHTAKVGNNQTPTLPKHMYQTIINTTTHTTLRLLLPLLLPLSIITNSCKQENNNTKKITEQLIIEQLNSNEFQTRIEAINTIEKHKYKKLNQHLINIILKPTKKEKQNNQEEKYLCGKALGKTLTTKKAIKYSLSWLDSKQYTTQITALYLIDSIEQHKINKKEKQIIGKKINTLLNKEIKKNKPNKKTIQKIARIISKINYQNAYKNLLYIAKEKQIITNQIINTLNTLKKQNKYTEKLLPQQKIKDKRITKNIKKIQYLNKNQNINQNKLIQNLINLKSNVFITAYNAENYFKLFLANKNILKNTFGTCKTYNPNKIKYIIANRIPILKKALNDKNDKIRFKTIKILANIKNKTLCQPLKKAYYKKENENFKQTILYAIAQINCPNNKNFIEQEDYNKNYNSPFFIYLKNNPKLINTLFEQYQYLYAHKKLFPSKLKYINKLINSNNQQIKINALYSLATSKINTKNNILKNTLKKENNYNIKSFIQELIKYHKL